MGTGYKNRGSGAAGLGFKNRGAKLVEGAAYTNRGATDGVNEAFKNRGQAWGSDAYYNRGPNDFASLSVLGLAEFYAPLTHSLVLTRGTGSATFTRATKAWEFGYAAAANAGAEQLLIEVATGTPRFGGARYDAGTWYSTYADGSAIPESSLLGYHAEGARTNSLLWSRNLAVSPYRSSTAGSELLSNGTFADATGWTLASGWSVSGGVLNCAVGTNANATISVPITAGKTYTITITVTVSTAGYASISLGSGALNLTQLVAGTMVFNTLAASANSLLILYANAAFSGTFDNISVKEADIQVTTCTGIDNAANSASTLTAGAADATILQTVSPKPATAARSFSAYVTRRTGVGPVYITRDGFTTEVDISGSLQVGSLADPTKRYRVKIENTTVDGPVVGFKIATSGDAIDVDVCQDEAWGYASSPIVTTTAAVTRNADSLDYATTNVSTNSTFAGTWNTPTLANSGIQPIIGTKTNSIEGFGKKASSNNFYIANPSEVTTATGSALTVNTFNKFAGTLNGTTCSISANGGAVSSAADASSWTASKLRINGDGWGSQSQGYLKNVYIWSTALTDAQLQQVTA